MLTLQPLKSALSTQTTFIFHESHIFFTYTFITLISICHTCSKNLLTSVSFIAELPGGHVVSLRGLWDPGQLTLMVCFSLKDVVGVLQQHQLNKNYSACAHWDTWVGTPHCLQNPMWAEIPNQRLQGCAPCLVWPLLWLLQPKMNFLKYSSRVRNSLTCLTCFRGSLWG